MILADHSMHSAATLSRCELHPKPLEDEPAYSNLHQAGCHLPKLLVALHNL